MELSWTKITLDFNFSHESQVLFNEIKGIAAVSWLISLNSSTPHAVPHLDVHLLCEAGAVWNISSPKRREGTQTQPLGSFAMVSTFHLGSFQCFGQAVCSAPGSLHQCYHLLYLLKVHKSLENSWAIFKSGCWTPELLERHQMAPNVQWQQQGDVGFLQLRLETSKLPQKRFHGICPLNLYR